MSTQCSRRNVVAMLGGGAVGSTIAWGHDLRPGDPSYRFRDYEEIVNRNAQVKQVFQWPTLTNPIIFSNIRNSLNGFQFSYEIPPDDIQVVVQAYATANAATYDDTIWEKYRWGEALGIRDPQTNQPATRNIWYGTTVGHTSLTPGSLPADRTHPFYDDLSIEGLQRRRVLFLA